MADFNTQYNYSRPESVCNTGPILVETAGFISMREQIDRMMKAGEAYQDWRDRNYGFDYDDVDSEDDDESMDTQRYEDDLDILQKGHQALDSLVDHKKYKKRNPTPPTPPEAPPEPPKSDVPDDLNP